MKAFQCSANCCRDQQSSQNVVQQCLAGCMQPVLDAEKNLQEEVQQLQVGSFFNLHMHWLNGGNKLGSP